MKISHLILALSFISLPALAEVRYTEAFRCQFRELRPGAAFYIISKGIDEEARRPTRMVKVEIASPNPRVERGVVEFPDDGQVINAGNGVNVITYNAGRSGYLFFYISSDGTFIDIDLQQNRRLNTRGLTKDFICLPPRLRRG